MNSEDILMQIKDCKPQSTETQLIDFLHSKVHTDFKNEIIARIEDMRDFNEECSSKQYLETRGGILALRMVLNVFSDLVLNKQEDERSTYQMKKEEDSDA